MSHFTEFQRVVISVEGLDEKLLKRNNFAFSSFLMSPTGDDDGELQDRQFAVGKGSRPQRAG